MEVGFIGVGAMGRGMVARLLSAGHQVRVWNRSTEPLKEVTQLGARPAASPDEIFAADIAITMLADDEAVRAAILDRGLIRARTKELIHIVMSTLSVSFARELEREHLNAGIVYIAAPVMGRPDAAASGKLNILAAGDPVMLGRVRPLLEAMGQRVWFLGAEPHQANVVKLAINFMLAAAIEALSEAASLAERYEINPANLIELATGTLFACPAYITYGGLIVDREFKPGFRLNSA